MQPLPFNFNLRFNLPSNSSTAATDTSVVEQEDFINTWIHLKPPVTLNICPVLLKWKIHYISRCGLVCSQSILEELKPDIRRAAVGKSPVPPIWTGTGFVCWDRHQQSFLKRRCPPPAWTRENLPFGRMSTWGFAPALTFGLPSTSQRSWIQQIRSCFLHLLQKWLCQREAQVSQDVSWRNVCLTLDYTLSNSTCCFHVLRGKFWWNIW